MESKRKILTAKEAMAVPGARKCTYGEFQRRRMMTGAVKPKFVGEYLDEHGGRTAAVKQADGRYSQLTDAIWSDIEAAQTGGSYFLDGSSPTSGYTVGGYHGERRRAEELIVMPQEQLEGDRLGHENIDAAIELMVDEYLSVVGSASDAVVGWWLDVSSGYVYFDISQIYFDIDEAMEAAVDGMEEAIYDLGNGIEIPVWSAAMEKSGHRRVAYDVHQICRDVANDYGYIYDHQDEVPNYYELVDAGDAVLADESLKPLVAEICECRHDLFTSDREVAALYVALCQNGVVDDTVGIPNVRTSRRKVAEDDTLIDSVIDALRSATPDELIEVYNAANEDSDNPWRIYHMEEFDTVMSGMSAFDIAAMASSTDTDFTIGSPYFTYDGDDAIWSIYDIYDEILDGWGGRDMARFVIEGGNPTDIFSVWDVLDPDYWNA